MFSVNYCFHTSFSLACQEEFVDLEVEYITMPGWKAPTDKVRRFSDLPPNAQAYIRKIEELLEVPGKSLGFRFSDDMWAHWGKCHGICSRNSKKVNCKVCGNPDYETISCTLSTICDFNKCVLHKFVYSYFSPQ